MNSIMRKKPTLSYRFYDERRNQKDVAEELIKSILVQATPKSSCWWSKMKTRVDGFKSQIESIQYKQHQLMTTGNEESPWGGSTVKTCPGIVDLLKTAYLIKSPADIIITMNTEGGYCALSSDDSIISIDEHDRPQFYQEDATLFEGKVSLKFSIKLNIKTSGFGYVLADPTYHSNSGCFVPMGIVNSEYAKLTELNVITLVTLPKEGEKVITIKAGDVLAYLVPFEKCRLAFTEEDFAAKRFFKTFQGRHRVKI
jgi:hypothetical protein